MTSLERVLATLSGREPDRVPVFLLPTMHGARELGLSIRQYFSDGHNVAEGQLRMQRRYGHDCLSGLFHASLELEAFGGSSIFSECGPPNAGRPVVRGPSDILAMEVPEVGALPCLTKVLDAIAEMRSRAGADMPIVGVAISPFSLPVMQMGFEGYLDLLYGDADLFWKLMDVNSQFCSLWANLQLEAGATAICYFDPMASPSMVEPAMYRRTGMKVAQQVIASIKGPVATHMASGICMPIVHDLVGTGTAIVAVSALEDLSELKGVAGGRVSLLGNLDGIAMAHWTDDEAESAVKSAIARAGRGGQFILSDNHGEIPWQVPEGTLMAIMEAARKWGVYPLNWVDDYGD